MWRHTFCLALVMVPLATRVARADSDGYYCIGPNYLAYQYGVAAPPVAANRVYIVRLGGPTGIGAPDSVDIPPFRVGNRGSLVCAGQVVRLVNSGAHLMYTISFDASGKPKPYTTGPISAGGSPMDPGLEPGNLGQEDGAMRLGRAVDRVPLTRDPAGNEFLLEVFGDSTATNQCDPGVGARIVELNPSGSAVRTLRLPGRSATIASCLVQVQRYLHPDSVRPPPPPKPRPTYPGLDIEAASSTDSGEVCFVVPSGLVDWTGLANATIGAERVKHPSTDSLRAYYNDVLRRSTVGFSTAVTAPVANASWLIIHESGVLNFTPSVLRGEVTYEVNEGMGLTDPPSITGTACGRPRGPKIYGAFVVRSQAAGTWTSEAISTASSAPGVYAFTALGMGYTFAEPPEVPVGLMSARMLHGPNGTRLLLITWERDFSDCAYEYSLYAVEGAGRLRPLRLNAYGCDI